MDEPRTKQDLTETSPLDTKAAAEALRAGDRLGTQTRGHPAQAGQNGSGGHRSHPGEGGGQSPAKSGEQTTSRGGESDNKPANADADDIRLQDERTAAASIAGVGSVGGAGGPLGGTSEGSASRSKTKGGTNVDTMIGRIVVDQGLATPEEVHACLEQARSLITDGNNKTLSALLVENAFITRRQLERVKAQAEAERSGQQIPGYKILGKLGQGAMATVFKARQLSLDRLVAIKVLPRKFTDNPQFIERFYAEGRSAAQLNHPNIVQAYDVGQAGEYHYFVMEFVEGRTVYDDIVKQKRVPEKEALEIMIQTAEALQHAHAKGLIHRDVKPKNIMLSQDGVAKLADMGLARAISDKEAAEAEQGKAFGTPYYISPEQIRGEVNIGPPTDIYSLGATLYHMVTGAVPFDGKNPSAVMHKHLKAELAAPDHVNPKLSPGVSEIIEMMMSKNPRDRYQTCADLLIDLRAARVGQNPPIAHKDLGGGMLADLAKAEADVSASAAVPVDTSRAGFREQRLKIMLWVMGALLAVSVIVNFVLASR